MVATARKIGEVLANVEIFGVPQVEGLPPQTTATLQIRQDIRSGAMALPILKGDRGATGPMGNYPVEQDDLVAKLEGRARLLDASNAQFKALKWGNICTLQIAHLAFPALKGAATRIINGGNGVRKSWTPALRSSSVLYATDGRPVLIDLYPSGSVYVSSPHAAGEVVCHGQLMWVANA